jgi:hypothetical protein
MIASEDGALATKTETHLTWMKCMKRGVPATKAFAMVITSWAVRR